MDPYNVNAYELCQFLWIMKILSILTIFNETMKYLT